jgi:hypothetical protein
MQQAVEFWTKYPKPGQNDAKLKIKGPQTVVNVRTNTFERYDVFFLVSKLQLGNADVYNFLKLPGGYARKKMLKREE